MWTLVDDINDTINVRDVSSPLDLVPVASFSSRKHLLAVNTNQITSTLECVCVRAIS